MYKLNIKTTVSGYECIIKKRCFKRLWLTVFHETVTSKAEAKAIYRTMTA